MTEKEIIHLQEGQENKESILWKEIKWIKLKLEEIDKKEISWWLWNDSYILKSFSEWVIFHVFHYDKFWRIKNTKQTYIFIQDGEMKSLELSEPQKIRIT